MNLIDQPPVETNGRGSSQPYEELLRAFFRSEMPDPWPAFERPEPRILTFPARRSRFGQMKSRLALAASVVILLVASWLLAGALRDSKQTNGTQPRDVASDRTAPDLHKRPERPK